MANKQYGTKCKICGKIHRLGECGGATVANISGGEVQDVANDIGDKVANESTTYRYRNPEKRRAYMREYMARRRSGK